MCKKKEKLWPSRAILSFYLLYPYRLIYSFWDYMDCRKRLITVWTDFMYKLYKNLKKFLFKKCPNRAPQNRIDANGKANWYVSSHKLVIRLIIHIKCGVISVESPLNLAKSASDFMKYFRGISKKLLCNTGGTVMNRALMYFHVGRMREPLSTNVTWIRSHPCVYH